MLYCLAILLSLVQGALSQDHFIAIAYHDVVATVDQADADAVTKADLVKHFQWLKENGYHPIHPNDIFKARKEGTKLPKNAVLISFDDGYETFYTIVYPLLKAFQFPAVLGIVGSWVDAKETGGKANYGNKLISGEKFVTWQQLKEMSASGLVEVASHTFNAHQGVIANPQGTTQAALITRMYDKNTGTYETFEAYKARIEKDLTTNSKRIEQRVGKKPRVIIWPYGRYNQFCINHAKKLGMEIMLTLDNEEYYDSIHNLEAVDRHYYTTDQDFASYVATFENAHKKAKDNTLRAVRIDLDKIYDPDPQQIENNLSLLISRLYKYNINAVFLQAFVDDKAKGYAQSVYFPNRHLPVKSDIFNRICWQLIRRAHVKVYAWMPIMAFDFQNDDWLIKRIDPSTKEVMIDPKQYKRSSLFHPMARKKILEVFEDLGAYAPISGIMFHDDTISDFEDWSPAALEAMKREGLPTDHGTITANPALFKQWTQWKTKAVTDLTQEIIKTVKVFRPTIKTSRSLFAMPVLNPDSEAWFAQNFPDFLESYDYTALMAMPYMENASDPSAWLEEIHEKVKSHPSGLQKTIFELQTVDWRDNNAPIDTKVILEQMRELSSKGVRHFSLYPDDMFKNHPTLEIIKEGISIQQYPYQP